MAFAEIIVFFVIGLVLLTKGSDFIVDAAARTAKQLGVSELVIGLTIVAIGTSLPEISNSITAALYGSTDLSLGNVVGANISNIALILALSAIFVTIRVSKEIYDRDAMLMLACSVLLFLVSLNGAIGFFDSIFFLLLFILYIFYFFRKKKRFEKQLNFFEYVQDFFDLKKIPVLKKKYQYSIFSPGLDYYAYKEIVKRVFFGIRRLFTIIGDVVRDETRIIKFFVSQIFLLVLGIAMVIFGADIVVKTALSFPLPQHVVGMVFVSIGTTIPEAMVAITSLRKGYSNIMIGNTIGSVITNTLFILGITALIRPISIQEKMLLVYLPFFVLINLVFLVFLRNDYKINRREGIVLFILYIVFVFVSLFYIK